MKHHFLICLVSEKLNYENQEFSHGVVQLNNMVFAGLRCCEIVTGLFKIFICKNQQITHVSFQFFRKWIENLTDKIPEN